MGGSRAVSGTQMFSLGPQNDLKEISSQHFYIGKFHMKCVFLIFLEKLAFWTREARHAPWRWWSDVVPSGHHLAGLTYSQHPAIPSRALLAPAGMTPHHPQRRSCLPM